MIAEWSWERTMGILDNYQALLAKIDELSYATTEKFAVHISCRPGCDGCCRHLSLFTVEGFALAHALTELPDEQVELIRSMARNAGADAPCPLLSGGVCLLYNARPIICRTHGLPLLMVVDGEHRIDFCPLNFKGVEALPGGSVLDLERLNIALAAVNAHFIETVHIDAKADDRLSVAEALLLEL